VSLEQIALLTSSESNLTKGHIAHAHKLFYHMQLENVSSINGFHFKQLTHPYCLHILFFRNVFPIVAE